MRDRKKIRLEKCTLSSGWRAQLLMLQPAWPAIVKGQKAQSIVYQVSFSQIARIRCTGINLLAIYLYGSEVSIMHHIAYSLLLLVGRTTAIRLMPHLHFPVHCTCGKVWNTVWKLTWRDVAHIARRTSPGGAEELPGSITNRADEPISLHMKSAQFRLAADCRPHADFRTYRAIMGYASRCLVKAHGSSIASSSAGADTLSQQSDSQSHGKVGFSTSHTPRHGLHPGRSSSSRLGTREGRLGGREGSTEMAGHMTVLVAAAGRPQGGSRGRASVGACYKGVPGFRVTRTALREQSTSRVATMRQVISLTISKSYMMK